MQRKLWLACATLFLSPLVCAHTQSKSLIRLQSATLDPQFLESSQIQNSIISSAPAYKHENKLWILSFRVPITESLKAEIEDAGFEILHFIPDQSLLIRGPMKSLDVPDLLSWIAFDSQWKWSSDLLRHQDQDDFAARIIMVRLFTKQDRARFRSKIERFQRVFVLHDAGNYFVLRGYMSDLEEIAKMEEVAHLQKLPEFRNLGIDIISQPDSVGPIPLTGYETGTKLMNFESAWAAGFSGEGQIIGIGSTGFDRGSLHPMHPDFNGAILKGQNLAPFGRTWKDSQGQGTQVAGLIASRGIDSAGNFRGGAYRSRLFVSSLWSERLQQLLLPTLLSDLFDPTLKLGGRIHSNTWGSRSNLGVYDSYARQVDEYVFHNPDFLIVLPAGNEGIARDRNESNNGNANGNSIVSPATAKNALSVGASENYQGNGEDQNQSTKTSNQSLGLAKFSSRGPTQDGRIKPDLVTPGTQILSARSSSQLSLMQGPSDKEKHSWFSGTSTSASLASAAAALAREYLQKTHHIQKPSASMIKALLMNTAVDLNPEHSGTGGSKRNQQIQNGRPNFDEGFGRVDLNFMKDSSMQITVEENSQGLATGQVSTYEIEMKSSSNLFVTLAWNDAPGFESAGRALVNNLDLEITGPDLKWISEDGLNNFEHFEKTAKPGRYQVKVVGRQIPMGLKGLQPYSLVIRTQSN